MDFTALGEVVNTASRMQSTAMVDEVVLSEAVYAEVANKSPDVQSRGLDFRIQRGVTPPADAAPSRCRDLTRRAIDAPIWGGSLKRPSHLLLAVNP